MTRTRSPNLHEHPGQVHVATACSLDLGVSCILSVANSYLKPMSLTQQRVRTIDESLTFLQSAAQTDKTPPRIWQRRPPISKPMCPIRPEEQFLNIGCVDHWCGMEIPRVVLACLWVGIGGHQLQSYSETDAGHLSPLVRASDQHVF